MTETFTTGGCLCGAVRYEITGAPRSVIYCHCESCRKHAGAPVVALAEYRLDQLRYSGAQAPQVYASSPGVGRASCRACGTPLTWEGDGGEIGPVIELLVGTMDRPQDFPPSCHIHYAERLAWFDVADDLPRFNVWHEDGQAPACHGPMSLQPAS